MATCQRMDIRKCVSACEDRLSHLHIAQNIYGISVMSIYWNAPHKEHVTVLNVRIIADCMSGNASVSKSWHYCTVHHNYNIMHDFIY